MKKIKASIGVFKLETGEYSAEIGIKRIGLFPTEQLAATNYNNYIANKFSFPVFNRKGKIPETVVEEIVEKVVEEQPKEINKPLKEYLAKKELEKEPLDQALEILKKD